MTADTLTTRASPGSTLLARGAVILTYLVFGALLNSVGAIILLSVQSLGASQAQASLLDAYKDLPIAVVSFLVASVLPRLGLKNGMLLGLALVGAGCVAMPLLASFWAIKLMFVTIGSSFALVKVAAYSMIGLMTRDERGHASFTNLMEGLFMFGVLGGYWLFSQAVDDAAPASLTWLRAYWLLALLVGLSFVLLLLSRVDEREARPSGPARTIASDIGAMWALLGSGLIVVFLCSAFLYVLVEQGVGTWLPSFNRDVVKMPTAMSVGMAVIMPLSIAVGRLTSSAALARIGWFPVVTTCIAAVAALIVLTVFQSHGLQPDPAMDWFHAPAVAYFFPLIGLFLAPIYPAINSTMLSVLPKSQHAAMTGLIVIFSALGGSSGSFVTGRMFMTFDGRTAFALLLVPLAALVVALWTFRSALIRRRAGTSH